MREVIKKCGDLIRIGELFWREKMVKIGKYKNENLFKMVKIGKYKNEIRLNFGV